MVRIGIEASERIGLGAEAMTGPAIMSVRPQCRQRPLSAGQILTATVRYWQGSIAVAIVIVLGLSGLRVAQEYRRGVVFRWGAMSVCAAAINRDRPAIERVPNTQIELTLNAPAVAGFGNRRAPPTISVRFLGIVYLERYGGLESVWR
jgi:hypothetical protein